MLRLDPDRLHLCAWMLSSLPSERLAFLKMLLPLQLNVDDLPPEERMTIDYNISLDGVPGWGGNALKRDKDRMLVW